MGWPVLSDLAEGINAVPLAAVWSETLHPLQFCGHRWIVSIQPTTIRFHSRSVRKAVSEPNPVWLSRASRAPRFAESLAGGLCQFACGCGVPITQQSNDFRSLGEPDAFPGVLGIPGDARRWSFWGSSALTRDRATALIHPDELLASLDDGHLRSEDCAASNKG